MTLYDASIGYDAAVGYNGSGAEGDGGGPWLQPSHVTERLKRKTNRNRRDDELLVAAWLMWED